MGGGRERERERDIWTDRDRESMREHNKASGLHTHSENVSIIFTPFLQLLASSYPCFIMYQMLCLLVQLIITYRL